MKSHKAEEESRLFTKYQMCWRVLMSQTKTYAVKHQKFQKYQ